MMAKSKAAKPAKPKKKHRDEEFHEAIGGYDMFAPIHEEESEQEVQQKMVKQGFILLGLLVIQILLFAYLIQSTSNLGG